MQDRVSCGVANIYQSKEVVCLILDTGRIFLTAQWLSDKRAVAFLFHLPIAFTGTRFQALLINNGYLAADTVDDFVVLKNTGAHRDVGAGSA